MLLGLLSAGCGSGGDVPSPSDLTCGSPEAEESYSTGIANARREAVAQHNACSDDDDCVFANIAVDCGDDGAYSGQCPVVIAAAEQDAFSATWASAVDDGCSVWPACREVASCPEQVAFCDAGVCNSRMPSTNPEPDVDENGQRLCDTSTDDDVELMFDLVEDAVHVAVRDHTTCLVDDDCAIDAYFDVECPDGARTSVCNVAYAEAERDAVDAAWQDTLAAQCLSWPACLAGPECESASAQCVGGVCEAVVPPVVPPACDSPAAEEVFTSSIQQAREQTAAQSSMTCVVDDDCELVTADVDCGDDGAYDVDCPIAISTVDVDRFAATWEQVVRDNCTVWPACRSSASCPSLAAVCVDGSCAAVPE